VSWAALIKLSHTSEGIEVSIASLFGREQGRSMVARFKRPFAALTALVDVEQYVRFPVGKELSKCLTDAGN
jgi:hypothetical protein